MIRCRVTVSCGRPNGLSSNTSTKHLSTQKAFQTNKHLQRARLKGELKPMLSLAIHSYLSKKQKILVHSSGSQEPDYSKAIELLAPWNGYQPVQSSNLLPTTKYRNGRLQLGQGLVAEQAAFVAENYKLFQRIHKPESQNQQYPPFVEEDASWYRALEARVNDNLNRWEENARKRRRQRMKTAKQGAQRVMDNIQAPAAKLFGKVTAELGPVVERVRKTVRHNIKQANPINQLPLEENKVIHTEEVEVESKDAQQSVESTTDNALAVQDEEPEHNLTDPEDLIILTNDGTSLMVLNSVHPTHRLLALPTVTIKGKTKPAYRLRLARGGMVITVSIIVLGALPPTYRSIMFVSEYPRATGAVFVSLVASFAYNLWSWRSNSTTRQRELIAAAIQSRLVARDEAALSYLTLGAVDNLTDALMESYCSLLLSASEEEQHSKQVDPLVADIGKSIGLFRRPKKNPSIESAKDIKKEAIVAEEWEEARKALVHSLAVRM